MRETITTISRAVRNNINLTTATDPSTCERVGEEKSDTAGEGVSEEERRARQIAMILLLYTTNKMTGTIDAHTAATNCLRSLTGTSLDAVVSQLPADTVRDVREASSCLSEAGNPAEAIGSLHRDVMPATYRARRGQYWTPTRVAEVMGGWVIEHSGESVYEPGVGAGSLAAAVARRSHGKSGVGRICGIDTSALAGLMTQTAVAVENAALDFDFEQRPMRDVAASHSLTTDGIVANPPYLSAEIIEDAVKRDWQDHIREVVGRDVSERTPLHAYWLYDIASILQPGGVAAVLLPAEILAANYADELKRHLLAETNIKSLVLFDLGESLFQSATTRSLLLCLQKRVGSARAVPTQLVRVTEWPGSETLLSTLSSRQSGETDWGTIKVVRQADLQATEDWTARLEPSLPSDARCMCPLSEIATVRTGIVTGTNEFYCLSADDVAEWAIDETYLAPLLPSPQKITGCTYDQDDWDAHRSAGEDVYLLYHVKAVDDSAITSPQESERRGDIMTDGAGSLAREDGGVHAYLRHGMRTTVQAHTGIAANREPWYRVRRRQPADTRPIRDEFVPPCDPQPDECAVIKQYARGVSGHSRRARTNGACRVSQQ